MGENQRDDGKRAEPTCEKCPDVGTATCGQGVEEQADMDEHVTALLR